MTGYGAWADGIDGILTGSVQRLSGGATIRFTPYLRIVMPVDAFPFWVKGSLVSAHADLRKVWHGTGHPPRNSVDVAGSLHIRTAAEQDEVSSLDRSTIVFTTETEVRQFHNANFDTMWVGDFEGVKFALTERSSFYKQSGQLHYIGENIFPTMQTQLVDDLSGFDLSGRVISNSLPFWLEACRTDLPWLPGLRPTCPVFPSMIVPDNHPPPYVVIHVDDGAAESWQGARLYDSTMSSSNYVRETVRMTTIGLSNRQAEDLVTHIMSWSLISPDGMGVCRNPVIQDAKEVQPALNALSMRKTIEWDVNYCQTAARDIAQKYILSVIPDYHFSSGVSHA